MGTLIKNEFRTHAARQFIESIDETSNAIYYVFMGKPQAYSESTTPVPTNSITNSQYQVWDEMVLGKHVTTDDAKHMIKRNDWANNNAYQAYDDQNGVLSGSAFHIVTT